MHTIIIMTLLNWDLEKQWAPLSFHLFRIEYEYEP